LPFCVVEDGGDLTEEQRADFESDLDLVAELILELKPRLVASQSEVVFRAAMLKFRTVADRSVALPWGLKVDMTRTCNFVKTVKVQSADHTR